MSDRIEIEDWIIGLLAGSGLFIFLSAIAVQFYLGEQYRRYDCAGRTITDHLKSIPLCLNPGEHQLWSGMDILIRVGITVVLLALAYNTLFRKRAPAAVQH